MNDITLLEYLSNKIREELATYEQEIVSGRSKDLADYKYLCGIRRGLLIANEVISATKERMENDDE